MKSYTVVITLPDLPAARAEWVFGVDASAIHVAVSRALAALRRDKRVKGRRISKAVIVATLNKKETNQ